MKFLKLFVLLRSMTWTDLLKYTLSIIGVSLLGYRFIRDLSWDFSLVSLIISFIMSFVITNFVLDKFTYSKNFFMRVIQKISIYTIIFLTLSVVSVYLFELFNWKKK